MHPAPGFRREIHPVHIDGANVTRVKADKADADQEELILRLHQPGDPRAHPFREVDHGGIEVLELGVVGSGGEADA